MPNAFGLRTSVTMPHIAATFPSTSRQFRVPCQLRGTDRLKPCVTPVVIRELSVCALKLNVRYPFWDPEFVELTRACRQGNNLSKNDLRTYSEQHCGYRDRRNGEARILRFIM